MNDYVFFFKQKTAYEIYQCDWSSDVCSSDLETEGENKRKETNIHGELNILWMQESGESITGIRQPLQGRIPVELRLLATHRTRRSRMKP